MMVVTIQMNPLPTSWIQLDDTAEAALFLVSEESRFVTGTTTEIDADRLHE